MFWLNNSAEEILSILSMYFAILLFFPLGKENGPCIWTNFNLLHPCFMQSVVEIGWVVL